MFAGHDKHKLHGLGKKWQRVDAERLIQALISKGYVKEDLVQSNHGFMPHVYLRKGPKAQEVFSENFQVRTGRNPSSSKIHF